eukprot:gnl/TRDRNA2_/TRDRNA2_153802_c0_seq2.p1 gnl/TRDRNA2_/TRDRNA2_153802_c0~~gnl/TRDRNA2_/TRDRNA2_153802_c0_seq2.p1  ORF type:complete len:117 (+),score=2.39 gnl/TRDRNA2_/TRDRNA2_153802_c0_seq2:254-604(+)
MKNISCSATNHANHINTFDKSEIDTTCNYFRAVFSLHLRRHWGTSRGPERPFPTRNSVGERCFGFNDENLVHLEVDLCIFWERSGGMRRLPGWMYRAMPILNATNRTEEANYIDRC